MKLAAACLLFASLLLKSCDNHGQPQCVITPPASITDNRDKAIKISADLTKLVAVPISASVETNIKSNFSEAYQTIPDKLGACQMVLHTILCLRQRPDEASNKMASDLIKYIGDQNICKTELKQMLQLQ